jgi:hypothetical protein
MPHTRPNVEALNYDSLPPGSDIACELDENSIRITIPASDTRITLPPAEIPLEIRRNIRFQSLTHAAIVATVIIFPVTYLLWTSHLPRDLLTLAVVAFLVFGLAFFALVWRTLYTSRCDTLTAGRRQLTLINATSEKLLIETAGPFGSQSHDLDPRSIRSITLARLPNRPASAGAFTLAIELPTETIHIAPARLPAELHWLTHVLRERIKTLPKKSS